MPSGNASCSLRVRVSIAGLKIRGLGAEPSCTPTFMENFSDAPPSQKTCNVPCMVHHDLETSLTRTPQNQSGRRFVHEEIWYKSYVMRIRLFMSKQTASHPIKTSSKQN
ncbi:uncharacterized protein LOC129241330 [Anastrepha obliqua]|uniref:uncharacterized protein LOC129241330 n=1 Tax=Anastrepha obliqua TaxID=95512 RepID=UPI002409101B|nr:uncharacterized protein LOC129241330 [Anastrepha obliqua]